MKCTAQDIYNKLLDYKIKELHGQIRFHLGSVSISVKRKDVVGNIIQEWVESWLQANGIEYKPNPNTQMPPDVFLDPNNLKTDLLEIKAFNYEAAPAFDIADFKSFAKEIIQHPYYLDTDYLIFGYTMDENNGDVLVNDLWLKKVWEISRPMKDWPVNLQIKNGIVHKLRPGTWYSRRPSMFRYFASKEDYLSALEEAVYRCPETHNNASRWRISFQRSYKNFYHTEIHIPHWNEIEQQYVR